MHVINEILLKVALNTITLTTFLYIFTGNSKYLIKYLISFYVFIQSKMTKKIIIMAFHVNKFEAPLK